jgi:cell division protein FtsB
MDFRAKDLANIRQFPTARASMRAVAEGVPQAEVMAASWVEIVHPLGRRVYGLRRRIATVTVGVLAGLLFVHAMFGANGMMVYKQKRMEYQSLRNRIAQQQKENDLYTQRIQGLKTDQKFIEKEAREQLHYARPGEYVYVPPAQSEPILASQSAKK